MTLIRPLLEIHRTELIGYLAALGQPYREDSSNTDKRFTRNRIRHELLPHLTRHYNSAVGDALLRLGHLAGEAQGVVDDQVRRLIEEGAVTEGDDGLFVRRDELHKDS